MFRNLWENIRQGHAEEGPRQGRGPRPAQACRPACRPRSRRSTATTRRPSSSGQEAGIRVPPCFIIVCKNTSISKLVYDFISGFHRKNEDGTTHAGERPPRHCSATSTRHGNPLAAPEHAAHRQRAARSRRRARRQLPRHGRRRDRALPPRDRRAHRRRPRQAENITDQDLLREVMNTVGKPGQLGGSIRCVVSVSMLTEGWDANTVTHVLGVRAFGTQLLCEQVIGRALRRQSYDLNEEGLFNVEYADVLGIPFDFTAKPVVAPPQPPRETIQVKAIRPERDALEIRFPRVEGYRVELPEERLTAEFNDDSVLELTPDLVGAVDHAELRHHRRGGRPEPRAHRRHAALHAALPPDAAPALHQVARPRRGAQAPPLRPAQAHHQAVARHAAWSARAAPTRRSSCTRNWPTWPANRITAGITRAFVGERPIKARARPLQPDRLHRARPLQHLQDRPLGDRRHGAATSTG